MSMHQLIAEGTLSKAQYWIKIAQEKVHVELDCVLGEKRDVTEDDLKEMVYLEQVCFAHLDI